MITDLHPGNIRGSYRWLAESFRRARPILNHISAQLALVSMAGGYVYRKRRVADRREGGPRKQRCFVTGRSKLRCTRSIRLWQVVRGLHAPRTRQGDMRDITVSVPK